MNNNTPKVIAMYLPQFHQIPENDEWWGKGYTEWTAVKKAEPLFEGHLQPRKPLNNNYYNLLEKSTMTWQAELMHKYGVDGMCFYHYYFEAGKKLLEKPAENLLGWKDIDMPFCFSWANETWARTWSKFSDERNPWNTVIEPQKEKEDDKGVLILQDYGGEEEWKAHFNYLIPFFKDDRYIKKDGKPVFLFHRASSIPCLLKMKQVWDKLAQENGFPGLYYISTNRKSNICDAELFIEPDYSIMRYISVNGKDDNTGVSKRVDYNKVCENSMNLDLPEDKESFFGVTPGYDDTPRKGKGGVVLENCNPEMFQKVLAYYMAVSEARNRDFVFINAWNEWGESMYLEPDEIHNFAFLETINKAKEIYKEVSVRESRNSESYTDKKAIDVYQKKLDQFESFWRAFDKWMILKENNISLERWFIKKGYKSIAVYGIGMLGQHFIKDVPVEMVCYGLDRKAGELRPGFPVYREVKDASGEKPDVMVVTVLYEYEDIYNNLSSFLTCPIYSLEEIIDDEMKEVFSER